jgi:hypothetical protein
MISEGYDAFEDLYCYPGTSVLRNRLPAVIASYFGKLQPLRDELRKILA